MDSADEFIEDFGQRIDLKQRIREVLLNYPEGTTILKELIQNADDAGASRVCFCVDRRQHSVRALISSSMAEWQGPSLLSYNNAQFTQEDFESISRIGDSKKQGQSWKTGRFGVGFNSVYHLSDVPSFVSGKYVVFFDPHCRYLPRISSANPGKRIDFVASRVLENYKDQFQPYCAFGCDMKKPFEGTLFRFPLRSEMQASASLLSKQCYTSDDMSSLIRDLFSEAALAMLFLKNIETIELYEWSEGAVSPFMLYSCSVGNPGPEIRHHRQAFLRMTKEIQSKRVPAQSDVYRLDLVSKSYQDNGKEDLFSYLVSQRMASSTDRASALATAALRDFGLYFVPWASVAAKISLDQEPGRAFCFLPLPLASGLPVHVNGYFELSANRRDIWYGSDMEGMGKVRSDWNQCLLEDVAAAAFSDLIFEAREFGPGLKYYSMWPQELPPEPWLKMVKNFYTALASVPLLHSPVEGGRWITASEAVLHDEEYVDSDGLQSALISQGLPLVRPPKVVRSLLLELSGVARKIVKPAAARALLRRRFLHQQRSHAYVLLGYCLSDVSDEKAGKALSGLPLVPLQSEGLGTFGLQTERHSYFLCSNTEADLLKRVPDRLVEQNLPKTLAERLSRIASLGESNLRFLDDTSLLELLPLLLPAEWKNCDEVSWTPGAGKQPTVEWLTLLWDTLRAWQTDLSKFIEWPLLPTVSGMLKRPTPNASILRTGRLSKELEAILMQVGCDFLDPRFSIEHPQMARYVPDTAAVLLDALDHAGASTRFKDVSEAHRRDLKNYLYDVCWFSKNEMNSSRLNTFKSLPVFEVHNGNTTVFASLAGSIKFLAPSGVDGSFLGEEFVHSYSTKEAEVLSQLLGVIRMTKAVFFKQRVLNRVAEISAEKRDSLMLQVLRELPQLSIEDRSIVQSLRQLAFLPAGDGSLKTAERLYDPENVELLNLLSDRDFFPSAEYSTPEVLEVLRSLGLRSSILPDTIVACARRAQALLTTDSEKAAERGRALLAYMDLNWNKWLPSVREAGLGWVVSKATMLLQGEREKMLASFWSELSTICWCPVLVTPPHPHMPWPAVSQTVAPPRLVRLQTDMWLASATMRILDGQCHSPGLCEQLGWSSRLGGSVLAAQLLEFAKCRSDGIQHLGKVLAATIPRIYLLLTEILATDEMEVVKAILEGSRWVWVGSHFAEVEKVVFDGPSHLAPYLHVVPPDLAAFKELFVELGVRESLTPVGYSSLLSTIAAEKQDTPLEPRQLAAIIWIMQHLADASFASLGKETYVPDEGGVLVPSSHLVYNDAPWLLASRSSRLDRSYKFVHAKISNDVAEKVGIPSVRRSLLAESADFLDLGLHGGMEAFGQSESLTSRLKHIVEMYADGPGILFELLQNADDAGAKEVCFLLDKTHHGTNSVLSPQMAEWQGPSLYCYNDSVFKPEDLHAISRIGQNSKLEKPLAIGRFGLGFNSVYHFTDVPGFVSGSNVVMLDPHAANLPGITPAQPGLKINFVGRGLLKQFPDQFEPFLRFGCDLENPFNGTLFRFPLRGEATASRSEIKQEVYRPEDVAELLASLEKSATEVLLFLRSVKSIKVYVEDEQREMKQLLEVGKQHEGYREDDLLSFIRGNGHKSEFLTRLEKTTDKQLPWSCGKISISVMAGGEKQSSLWLVSSALGGGNAKHFSVQPANRSRGFVPWAGIAAKLPEKMVMLPAKFEDSLELTSSTVESRAFCFLPLPLKLGLPVNVNGYFELSANRRDIWYGGDMVGAGKLKSQWNRYLVEDAAAPAYARLLQQASREMGPGPMFQSLWPVGHFSEPWLFLVEQLYRAVVSLDLPVFYTAAGGGKWISASQAVFPDFSFPEMVLLGNALVEVGLRLVSVPKAVVTRVREVHPSLRILRPQLLRKLLLTSRIFERKIFDRRAIIIALKYSLSDIRSPEETEQLLGLSLLPLINGSYGTFGSRSEGKIVITNDNEYELLKDAVPHLLLDPEAGEDVRAALAKLASYGTINVFVMTSELLAELLLMVLPRDWAEEKQVLWSPGLNGHPTEEWFDLLWKYFSGHSDDLSAFRTLHLLPTSSGKLLQLVEGGPVLINDSWSENMASLLETCGCFLVSKDFASKYPLVGRFVHDSTARGVLLAMFSAAGGMLRLLPTLLRDCPDFEVRELRHFLFQSKWFAKDEMDSLPLEVLRMLRLIECGRNSAGTTFISIAESNQLIAPAEIDEELLGDMFVRAKSTKEEQILIGYLGLKKLSKRDYFVEHFAQCLERAPLEHRSQAFLKVLKEATSLMGIAPSSMKLLSQISFVPTASGSIEPPERLYDPRVSELQTLLNKDAFFPRDEFSKNEILDLLVHLGLRKTLGRNGLLDAARSVSMTDEAEASRRGKALLSHMDSLVAKGMDTNLLLDEQFWMELASISWCPVCLSSPHPVLPWLHGEPVSPPKLVRPASDVWLVSGAMRVLDGDCCEALHEKFGWKATPNAGVLANQITEISTRYMQMQSSKDPLTDDTMISRISKGVICIYEKLQGFLNTQEMLVIQSVLEDRAWLWTGEGFVTAEVVALDASGHFHPYLHAVPLELLEFRDLFQCLGVRTTFNVADYLKVLRRVSAEANGEPLGSAQLTFVLRLLEAIVEVLPQNGSPSRAISELMLLPDATSYLVPAKGLVYNDAPWLATPGSGNLRLVHPDIDNDIARQLGARSLRYLSVVDEQMTSSLPCMGVQKISEILSSCGGESLLLYDLIEIADCCNAKKVHFIYDTRDHPKQSLLQPNFCDYQGPALVVALENAYLTAEEICALHAAPPVKLHGHSCRYGSGLLGVYHLTDLLSIVSGGCLYFFDPSGKILSQNLADGKGVGDGKGVASESPLAKAFKLQGTGLPERFNDQLSPFYLSSKFSWESPNVTIFRLPLRSSIEGDGGSFNFSKLDVNGLFDKLTNHVAASLLFLKSLEAVTLSKCSELEPLQETFSVSIDSSFASLRHPFQEQKWRKFQLSSFFGAPTATTKMHTIDVNIKREGSEMVSKWLVVQSLGSGCTRDMALDRRYLQYQLTPVGGVAACISAASGDPGQSHILSPLPIPVELSIPVTLFGNFLPVFEAGDRHIFNESLGDYPVKVGVIGAHTRSVLTDEIIRATWNRQLVSCISDSYVELLQELQHLQHAICTATYSFWPRSKGIVFNTSDARCLVKWLVKPLYTRLLELPLWELQDRSLVKFSEGVFVATAGQGSPPKTTVSEFLRAHYRVFTVPWEVGKEAEDAGGAMKELTPKVLRALMKFPSVAAAAQSLETQIDLLEYCCADAGGGSSLAEDSQINPDVLSELKGLACPTANEFVVKLGTVEVWVASSEQQELLPDLQKRFLHPLCLERPLLRSLMTNKSFQAQMNLRPFSSKILAANLKTVLQIQWAAGTGSWVIRDNSPSDDWLRKFWRNVDVSSPEELRLFAPWPLIPATNGSFRLLVRVERRSMVFVPPNSTEEKHQWLVPLLCKLGVPIFDSNFADSSVLTCCFSQEELVATVLSKLVEAAKAGNLQVSNVTLSPADRDELFTFLAGSPSSFSSEEALTVLRTLPIYRNIRGDYVEIDPDVHYIVGPSAVFQSDDEHRLPYLGPQEGGLLYGLLGVPVLLDSQVLVRYTLPKFSLFDTEEQETILGHLYSNWNTWKADAALVDALKATKFVYSVSPAALFQPRELLDPENEILRQVFSDQPARFPEKKFSTSGWLRILRATGLRSIKDADLLLESARRIEELGKQDLTRYRAGSLKVSDAVWSMGIMLVEEIFNNFATLYGSNFCKDLSKIAFVPSETGIPSIAGGHPDRVLTSYSEAVLVKDWPLAWTCYPLLTRSSMVPPDFAWGALRLRSPPPISVVIKHLKVVGQNSGEDVLARWPNAERSRSVEDVFGEVLQYLSNIWDRLSDSEKKELSRHAFIPVGNGTRLVTANALYTRVGMDLTPFAFEVPRAFLSHVTILSELGMRYEPTVASTKALIRRLYESSGYQHLNPNELQAVMFILRFIADNAKSTSKVLEDLVVPDENSRLVSAAYCTYVDIAGARFVGEIDSSRVRLVHPKLSEDLCAALGVKKLSDTVAEETDAAYPLEPVDAFGDFLESSVRERLRSSVLHESLWQLLLEFRSMATSEAVTKERVVESLLFGADKLRFVKRLFTKFLLLPNRKDITLCREGKREHRAFYYLNKTAGTMLIAEPPEFISVPDLLALAISQLLGFSVCLPLAPLFSTKTSNFTEVLRLVSCGEAKAAKTTSNFNFLGSRVLPVDRKALQFCPLRPFYFGEIVAWHPDGQKSELQYGRVAEDIRAPAGQPLYHVRVETSPGKVQLIASANICSFKSTGGSTSSEEAEVASLTAVAEATSVDVGSRSESPKAPEERGMRATDYAQAISDILTSLGLPLTLEKQSLLEHSLTLQEQLSSSNTLLLAEQVRADGAAKELEATKSSWTCRVCLTSEVDSMLVPCGHVICRACCSTLARCPFCRNFISSFHRMYRP